MPTKILIIMSNNVNPISILGKLKNLSSTEIYGQHKLEQLISWLQFRHQVFSFIPLGAVVVFIKQLRNVHQTLSLRCCCPNHYLFGFVLGTRSRGCRVLLVSTIVALPSHPQNLVSYCSSYDFNFHPIISYSHPDLPFGRVR